MTRCYIMVSDSDFWGVSQIIKWADKSALVSHWRYDMPGCLYILSQSRAVELSKDFQAVAGRKGPFFFVEVADQIAGVMLPETWSILHEKRPASTVTDFDNFPPVEAEKSLQPAAN